MKVYSIIILTTVKVALSRKTALSLKESGKMEN